MPSSSPPETRIPSTVMVDGWVEAVPISRLFDAAFLRSRQVVPAYFGLGFIRRPLAIQAIKAVSCVSLACAARLQALAVADSELAA